MAAHVRTECAACGGSLKTILDLGLTPLADRFPISLDTLERNYPLRMAACTGCGLCQLLDVVDDDELFGDDYGFRTSGSPALEAYYAAWASWALKFFRPQAQRLTVEIGCNDGTLLGHFDEARCPVLGIEPSGAAELARSRGMQVSRLPFCEDAALSARQYHGPAGLIIGVNVAAHVQDPVDFMRGVKLLLADDGVAIFEFQDLEHLVAGCQFDHVYHEHRQFYSAGSFTMLAQRAGLGVVRIMPTPGQGGSLRVVLSRADAVSTCSRLATWNQLSSLQERAEWTRSRLIGMVSAAAEDGEVAGYGATAKSCTLLNFCGIGPGLLSYIEDATPSKHGLFTPGTHIPIKVPGRTERPRPGTFLLLAWNYLGPVLRREQAFLQAGGKFIVPIPVPTVI